MSDELRWCAYCGYAHGPVCPNGYCRYHDLAPCPFCDPTKTNPLVDLSASASPTDGPSSSTSSTGSA